MWTTLVDSGHPPVRAIALSSVFHLAGRPWLSPGPSPDGRAAHDKLNQAGLAAAANIGRGSADTAGSRHQSAAEAGRPARPPDGRGLRLDWAGPGPAGH